MLPTEQDLGPLHQAILNGEVTRVKSLLEQGADPNQKAIDGESPLHYAMLFEQSGETAKALIEHGADPEGTNRNGFTPLIYAVRHRNIPGLSLLIEKNVALDTKEKYCGMTAMDWANNAGYPEVQEILTAAIEARQEAEKKAARETAEAEKQKRIAGLRDTATERQAILKKRRHKGMKFI